MSIFEIINQHLLPCAISFAFLLYLLPSFSKFKTLYFLNLLSYSCLLEELFNICCLFFSPQTEEIHILISLLHHNTFQAALSLYLYHLLAQCLIKHCIFSIIFLNIFVIEHFVKNLNKEIILVNSHIYHLINRCRSFQCFRRQRKHIFIQIIWFVDV